MTTPSTLWIIWLVSTLAGSAVLLTGLVYGGAVRARFLIGKTTSGHHQIELACEACHTTPFAGGPALQAACVSCHGEELKQAKDTHPAKKFTDPRNADRVEMLAARIASPVIRSIGPASPRHGRHDADRLLLPLPSRHRRRPAEPRGSQVRHLRLFGLPPIPRQPRALR